MQDRVVAIAADYADALLVVRRAKRLLLLLLMLALLGQLAIFGVAQFTDALRPIDTAPVVAAPTTSTTVVTTQLPSAVRSNLGVALTYATFVTLSAGVIFGILLSLTLFLTVHIMLVGRLIGVAHVTRAFVLSLLLAILLFPWQTVLATAGLGGRDFVLPGVLYTWGEISTRVPTAASDPAVLALYWGRFVALPLVALVVLLLVQVRSGKGLKLALGEEEVLPVDIGADGRTTIVR